MPTIRCLPGQAALLPALLITGVILIGKASWAQPAPAGEIKGTAVVHTAASARDAIDGGLIVLPQAVTGGAVYAGPLRTAPREAKAKVPVVVFMHGSSGLGLKAIGEWQAWLASLGIASFAPDSFSLPDRLTYKSPIGKEVYEQVHALRASEIAMAAKAVAGLPWADPSRIVLAGTSEGATAVARYGGPEFAGRMIYSWSCENNYFVQEHRSVFPATQPVLNVISATDPFFSPSNAWLGNPAARGHCGEALKDNRNATIVLIPGAPHTLLNLPAARSATAGFLAELKGSK